MQQTTKKTRQHTTRQRQEHCRPSVVRDTEDERKNYVDRQRHLHRCTELTRPFLLEATLGFQPDSAIRRRKEYITKDAIDSTQPQHNSGSHG